MTIYQKSSANRLLTEVAFVGKAPGAYVMLLGGGYYGQRLNKIYRGMFQSLCSYILEFNPLNTTQKMSRNPKFLPS
jgi:sulfite reductase beta subunit-like hemoprotein